MAEGKEESWLFALCVIVVLLALACLGGLGLSEMRYESGCEERCYPQQIESMTPKTGCICAEAK